MTVPVTITGTFSSIPEKAACVFKSDVSVATLL